MRSQVFSVGGVLKEGWELTKANLGFLIGYQVILYLLTFLSSSFHTTKGFIFVPLYLAGWAILVLAKMGFYNSALMITQGNKPTFEELYKNWRLFISWVIANFLFGVVLCIGLVLLIIPGLYILSRYGFFTFAILDRNLGPLSGLEQSGSLTEGIRWRVLLLFLACIGLNIIGALFFVIGLFFTVPTTLLALATAYRKLTSSPIVVQKLIPE